MKVWMKEKEYAKSTVNQLIQNNLSWNDLYNAYTIQFLIMGMHMQVEKICNTCII